MAICRWCSGLFAMAMVGACSTHYARLYVNTVEQRNQRVISTDVYSAVDGQFLGSTPLMLDIERGSHNASCILPVFLRREGTQTQHELLFVTRWFTSPAAADLHRNYFRIDFPVDSQSPEVLMASDSSPTAHTRFGSGTGAVRLKADICAH